jgi:hypothetical protein
MVVYPPPRIKGEEGALIEVVPITAVIPGLRVRTRIPE